MNWRRTFSSGFRVSQNRSQPGGMRVSTCLAHSPSFNPQPRRHSASHQITQSTTINDCDVDTWRGDCKICKRCRCPENGIKWAKGCAYENSVCIRKLPIKKTSKLTKWKIMSVEMLKFCERQLSHKKTDDEIVPGCPFSGRRNCNPEICQQQSREQIREQNEMGLNRDWIVHGILGSHYARVRVESLGLEISGVGWELTSFHSKFKLWRMHFTTLNMLSSVTCYSELNNAIFLLYWCNFLPNEVVSVL